MFNIYLLLDKQLNNLHNWKRRKNIYSQEVIYLYNFKSQHCINTYLFIYSFILFYINISVYQFYSITSKACFFTFDVKDQRNHVTLSNVQRTSLIGAIVSLKINSHEWMPYMALYNEAKILRDNLISYSMVLRIKSRRI